MVHNENTLFGYFCLHKDVTSQDVIAALPPSNVRLSNPEHVDWGLVQLDKHTIEDLAQTEQLQNFANLGADTIDTGKQIKMWLA